MPSPTDDIAARVLVLAEYRHAIAAWLLADAPAAELARADGYEVDDHPNAAT